MTRHRYIIETDNSQILGTRFPALRRPAKHPSPRHRRLQYCVQLQPIKQPLLYCLLGQVLVKTTDCHERRVKWNTMAFEC